MATYLVTVKKPDATIVGEHLIESKTQAQAKNHVADGHICVTLAKSSDIARLAKAGVEIVDVNAPRVGVGEEGVE